MGRKLCVGTLAFDVTSKDLEALSAQAGICESVATISERDLCRAALAAVPAPHYRTLPNGDHD